jgi:hypothetical protein
MTGLTVLVASWVSPDNLGEFVVKVLAVAGGALIGGLGSGLVLQLLVRMTTTMKVPKSILQVVRVLGAIALAGAVALFLFGKGGGTGGGLGWFAGGAGNGTGTGREGTPPEATGRETPAPRDTGRDHTNGAESARTLRVEVLVDRRNNATAFRAEGKQELLGLPELEKYVRGRREQAPALQRLALVIYLNSPDRDSGPVKELLAWARREGLEMSIDTPATNAPQ